MTPDFNRVGNRSAKHTNMPVILALTLMKQLLRIVTRDSRLALWQTEHVSAALKNAHPGLRTQILPMKTQGDTAFDQALPVGGGKGLFTKALEHALLDNTADIAVHSMKDVPTELPSGLIIAAILKREEPADAFVSHQYSSISQLPERAVVGTASLRRQCQLLHHYPHLQVKSLRGNLDTRLKKLGSNHYAAIILACAGLIRLDQAKQIRERLSVHKILPAIGQGAIGIECRANDTSVQTLLQCIHHEPTACCIIAERAVSKHLGADCRSPLAAYARLQNDQLNITALVGSSDGTRLLTSEATGSYEQARQIGIQAAEKLRVQGAGELLA